MRTAIDTNVISALWSQEPMASRMKQLLYTAHQAGGLVICGAVYAELHAYPKIKASFIQDFLSRTNIQVEYALSEAIWQLAAEAYAQYAERRRKSKASQPKRLLVDFMVGAHAFLEADQLLTLDQTRYKTSYPKLVLVPEKVS